MSTVSVRTAKQPPGRASLRQNISALYALQIANYIIPIVTLPYLMRTLGAAQYGVMAKAYATVFLMVLFVDAGFNTRATRALAVPKLQPARISGIYSATQLIKLAQSLLMLVLLCLLGWLVDDIGDHFGLYLASFLIVAGSLVFPTWLFQGLEIMHYTTVFSISGRLIATVGIFALVKGPADLLLAAGLQAAGTALSGLLSLTVVFRRLDVRLLVPRKRLRVELRSAWRESRSLAFSEYLTNAAANCGVFILGIFASDAAVGIYAAIEKVARAVFSLFQPFIKALFPRLSGEWRKDRERARVMTRQWVMFIVGSVVVAALCMAMLAGLGLEIVFGEGWSVNAPVLQLFTVWLVMSIAAAALGQLWLLPSGNHQSYSRGLLIGSTLQLALVTAAAALGGMHGVVIALLLAEASKVVFFARAVFALPGRSDS